MIKFVVARYETDSYGTFLGPCVDGKYRVESIFEGSSIYEKYNTGISNLEKDGISDDDIIVFCHGDVRILDESFEDKVLYIFDNIPKLGVAGVIGATEIHETGGWWLSDQKLHRGHVVQWIDDIESNKYHMIRTIGNYTNITVVDGLCFMVRGSLVKQLKFDVDTYPNSYNYYDYDYCLETKALGYKVGVFDILLEHGSNGSGMFQDDWKLNKEKFIRKWKEKGYSFPIK